MSLIGKTIGNYEITTKLGQGGMGTVYLGQHPLIGKKVAIKVLRADLGSDPDCVQRFFHEAKAVNDIGHANIVDIVDFGKTTIDDTELVYLVMEYLNGESMASRLRRAPLTLAESLYIMEQCCSALSASHEKGIVHRDLKPDNIYLCQRGSDSNFVKILDFGIAKLTSATGNSAKTRTGSVFGTPAYMSPEQCENSGKIDCRSDIYSLGIVFYELLTGRVPFNGEGFGEMMIAQMLQQPEIPSIFQPSVPAVIDAVVMHALEKNRTLRFQTMADLAGALGTPDIHAQQYHNVPIATDSVTGRPTDPMARGTAPWSQEGVDASAPHSTTLSGSAREISREILTIPNPQSRTQLVAMIGVSALIMGAVGLWRFTQPSQPQASAMASPPHVAPPPILPMGPAAQPANTTVSPPVVKTLSVKITTTPSGAAVYRIGTPSAAAGVPIGITPFDMDGLSESEEFDLKLHLDGFKDQLRHVIAKEMPQLATVFEPQLVAAQPLAHVRAAEPLKKHKRASQTESVDPDGDDTRLMKPVY